MRIINFIQNVITVVILFICLIVISLAFLTLEVYRNLKLIPNCTWRINAWLSRCILYVIGDRKKNEP